MMWAKLVHRKPECNDKKVWWVAIDETPEAYLVVFRQADGHTMTTVHAVLKTEYMLEGAVETVDDCADLI